MERSVNSDWFANNFIMVQSEFGVQRMTKKFISQTTIINIFINQSELMDLPTEHICNAEIPIAVQT